MLGLPAPKNWLKSNEQSLYQTQGASNIELLDTLDATAISLSENRGNSRYLTNEAINLAKANPGKPVRLNGGKRVARAYAATLHESAQKLDEMLEIHYLQIETTRKTSKSGNAYTVSKGEVQLTYGKAIRA